MKHSYYVTDGDTFFGIDGSYIISVPENAPEDILADIEDGRIKSACNHEPEFDFLEFAPITNENQILKWMRIFFPNMSVKDDNDGQIVIHTGVYL